MTINSWVKRATTNAGRVAAFSVVAACAGGHAPSPATSPAGASEVSVGARAEFTFESLDERPVSGESTRGKPTVITFVTTSSLAAQAQVDFLVAMAAHDAARVNYALVALESRSDREIVELYRKALAIPFPIALADSRTVAGVSAFGDLGEVPVTCLLDRAGRIVWRVAGRVAKSEEIRSAMHGL